MNVKAICVALGYVVNPEGIQLQCNKEWEDLNYDRYRFRWTLTIPQNVANEEERLIDHFEILSYLVTTGTQSDAEDTVLESFGIYGSWNTQVCACT